MTNKFRYFIGNWKMFGDFNSFNIIKKIQQFCIKHKKKVKKNKIILCVPNILLNFFNKKINSKVICLGAQNCSEHNSYGPFTGSVSASMLRKAGARYVILGHSENRREGESPILIKKKIRSALSENLNIIFCIGETIKEKRRGQTLLVLRNQIKKSIDKKFNLNKIIIAYEPVWSIGTGKLLNYRDLINTISYIKIYFKKQFKLKNFPKVLYGGSVNDKSIKQFSINASSTGIEEIHGFLIGGASQSSKKFIDIIKNYYKQQS